MKLIPLYCFSDNRKAGAEGRLWQYLLKETLNIFVDYVFRQQAGTDSTVSYAKMSHLKLF